MMDPELICDLYFSILSKQNLKINEGTKIQLCDCIMLHHVKMVT